MATAISATGIGKTNSLCEWEHIRIHFDDGTKRDLPNVTATLQQLFQLAKHPERYRTILGVDA